MKKLKLASLAVAAVVTAAGAAYAAPVQVNIYGASAQGDFWAAEAGPFATSLGCTVTFPTPGGYKATLPTSGTSVKYGYALGTACSNTLVPINSATGTRDIEIRSAGIASLEGPLAVGLQAPIETDTTTGCTGTGHTANERLMSINGTLAGGLACYKVNVGTTDLDAKYINQIAYQADGVTKFPLPTLSYTNLSSDVAIVVPFNMVVNSGVTARHCLKADNITRTGAYCTTDAQCGTGNHCDTNFTTIDNLSRLQVAMLFSGQVPTWKYLGEYFGTAAGAQGTAGDITTKLCLRQPGSGSHAAFEKMIMSAGDTAWGAPLASVVDPVGPPIVSYIKSSDDMVTCVQSAAGAVGYVDGDKDTSAGANVTKIKYNGNQPSRLNIRNGIYDYYAVGHMYTNSTTVTTLITDATSGLIAFAKNPVNIPTSKAQWYATVSEMNYIRNVDLSYPGYQGASNFQSP